MKRKDHIVIAEMVAEGASVLDIGCADGALLSLLAEKRRAKVRGMELAPEQVAAGMKRGLSIIQGDAEKDLAFFPNDSFDFVVMANAIQSMRAPAAVLAELLRIGRRAIISFHNYGHLGARVSLALGGRMPGFSRPEAVKPCSIADFLSLARAQKAVLERAIPIAGGVIGAPFATRWGGANLFAEEAVFLLKRG